MEQLKYIVEDTTIAELLGVQNFSTKESAFLELVKNAYDARASFISIRFHRGRLIIVDDGEGMDQQDIRTNWMHVGKSSKGYDVIDKDSKHIRVLAGSKGIGRFALARLGRLVVVSSKKAKCDPIQWSTDWKKSKLRNRKRSKQTPGTEIVLFGLRDKWTEKSIKNLADYFAITYKDSLMKIYLSFDDIDFNVNHYFAKPKLGKNCVSKISLEYNNQSHILTCNISSDEFKPDATKYYSELNTFQKQINLFDELKSDRDIFLSDEDLALVLKELGKFTSELYFSLKSSSPKELEDFLYKYDRLEDRYDNGIVLYRNAFSIASLEGTKDWLSLGKRSRKSPAAATHPTGAWRVRENQMSGVVLIDKQENAFLRDLSNRQGIEENEYFNIFIKIIVSGINIFERYRQNIIRAINAKNSKETKSETKIIRKIIKSPSSIKKLEREETRALVQEIKSLQATTRDYKNKNKETEKRYKYDIRILNVFATTGLKAAFIAHELQNDRNSIDKNYKCIVKALKTYGFWDDLNLPENTKYAYKDVPSLLLKNKKINNKLLVFMDTMLGEIEKKKFFPVELDVESKVDAMKSNWERDFAWLKIEYQVEKYLVFNTAEDILAVILDNLILNSLQQNEENDGIKVSLTIEKRNQRLYIQYKDNGVGLPPKYIDDPKRILDVHETSRPNGHGLGMWVVNNTIEMTGGEIIEISGHDGFSIEFELGDNFESN